MTIPAYRRPSSFVTARVTGGVIDTAGGSVEFLLTLRRESTTGIVDGEIVLDNYPDNEHSRWILHNLPLKIFEEADFNAFLEHLINYRPESPLRTEGARHNLAEVQEFAEWAQLEGYV